MTLLSALAVATTAHRPGRHADHVLQRPVQRGAAAGLARPDQRRPRRLERGDQRRLAGAAGNYGRDEHFDYDTRYGRALEFVASPAASGTPTRTTRSRATGEPGVFLDRRSSTARPQGRALLGRRPAEHLALAPGPAGHLPGRRLRGGPRPRRDDRRGHLHARARSIEAARPFYRRHQGTRGRGRAATPTTSSSCRESGVLVADTDAQARAIEPERRCRTRLRPRRWPSSAARSTATISGSTPSTRRSPTSCTSPSGASGPRREKIVKLARDNGFTLRADRAVRSPRRSRRPFAGSPQTVADEIQALVRGPRRWTGSTSTSATRPSSAGSRDEVVPDPARARPVPRRVRVHTLRGNLGLPVPENRYTRPDRRPGTGGEIVTERRPPAIAVSAGSPAREAARSSSPVKQPGQAARYSP